MKNCGIVDGTYVLFRKQQYAENGDVVACLVDGESATVKRFFKKKLSGAKKLKGDGLPPFKRYSR